MAAPPPVEARTDCDAIARATANAVSLIASALCRMHLMLGGAFVRTLSLCSVPVPQWTR